MALHYGVFDGRVADFVFTALFLRGSKFADGTVPGSLDGGFVAAESVEIAAVVRHAD